jgi:Mg-chelatase subunit ChlI
LLDRFAHAVDVVGITEADQRVEVLRRRVFFEQDPDSFGAAYEEKEQTMCDRIVQARQRYPLVKYTEKDMYTIAALTASFKVDGHRADIVILKTARAQAAYDGRLQINDKDILLAAELALPHRMKKQPFQDSVLNPDQLQGQHAPGARRGRTGGQRRGSTAGRRRLGDGRRKKSTEGDESELSESPEAGEGGVAQPDASPQQSSSPGDNKGAANRSRSATPSRPNGSIRRSTR